MIIMNKGKTFSKKIRHSLYTYIYNDGLQINHVFILFLLTGDVLFWVMQACLHGNWLDNYFVNDYTNTSMDYFNMLACLDFNDPYELGSNYPPMCFLVLKVLYSFIPKKLIGKGNGFYYRQFMQGQIVYMAYTLILILIVWELVKNFNIGKKVDNLLLAIGILFSGPVLFTLERGNLIFICLPCMLVFLKYFDAEEKGKRQWAYFALAVAASIKLYPALFGILILYKKRYREAIYTVILGLTLFLLPCFAFGGFNVIGKMLKGIDMSIELQESTGLAYNFSFGNLVKILAAFGGRKIQEQAVVGIILPLLICTTIFLLCREEWKKIYAVSLLCIWVPSFSYTYTLLFMILPMISCLKNSDDRFSLFAYIYRFCFGIILMPLCLPKMQYLDYRAKMPLTMATVIINIFICILTITILTEAVTSNINEFPFKRKTKNIDN